MRVHITVSCVRAPNVETKRSQKNSSLSSAPFQRESDNGVIHLIVFDQFRSFCMDVKRRHRSCGVCFTASEPSSFLFGMDFLWWRWWLIWSILFSGQRKNAAFSPALLSHHFRECTHTITNGWCNWRRSVWRARARTPSFRLGKSVSVCSMWMRRNCMRLCECVRVVCDGNRTKP